MKNCKIIVLVLLAAVISSCTKNVLNTPDFDVTADKTTIVKGDAVVFSFQGSPDNISFWSGETGRVYETRNNVTATGAVNRLSFTTLVANLAAGNTGQVNNLKLLVSTDFSGKVDSASIRKATWTDITTRAKLATSATALPSDTITVSDLATARDTMFIAFKYQSTTNSTASRGRSWTMAKFIYQNKFPDGSIFTHYTLDTDNRLSGFNQFSYKGTSTKDSLVWSVGTTNVFPSGVDNLSDEDWLISKPFKTSSRNPDKAVGIKNNQGTLDTYTYKFLKPGTYVVTFVANNAGAEGVKEVVKQITITVTN